MIIRYCPYCDGYPYTTNMSIGTCPHCGSPLSQEFVGEDDLFGRPSFDDQAKPWFGDGPFDDGGDYDWPPKDPDETAENTYGQDPTQRWGEDTSIPPTAIIQTPDGESSKDNYLGPHVHNRRKRASSYERSGIVRGRVANYSNTENEPGTYRRFFVQRLWDAIVYGQRFEDVLHRFTVRVDSDPIVGSYVDVPVNLHGTIAGGMQITNNAEVEVYGRYKNGVLMAQRIDVINAGARTTINVQHNVGAMLTVFGVAAICCLFAYGMYSSGGALLANLGSFLSIWLGMSTIVAVIWLFLLSRMGPFVQFLFFQHGKFPLVGILVWGLLLTLVSMNAFGLGNAAAGVASSFADILYAFMPLLIMLFGIYLMISSLFK